jgi:hypothetical protein
MKLILAIVTTCLAQNLTLSTNEVNFQGTLIDFKNATIVQTTEFDAIVPWDGNFAVSGAFSWMTSPIGVDFLSCMLYLQAQPTNFTNGQITTLYL